MSVFPNQLGWNHSASLACFPLLVWKLSRKRKMERKLNHLLARLGLVLIDCASKGPIVCLWKKNALPSQPLYSLTKGKKPLKPTKSKTNLQYHCGCSLLRHSVVSFFFSSRRSLSKLSSSPRLEQALAFLESLCSASEKTKFRGRRTSNSPVCCLEISIFPLK